MEQEVKRQCKVCLSPAAGVYFGAQVCLPCKSFYIRCTKDGQDSKLRCQQDPAACAVNNGRFKCQACRFRACLNAGMQRKDEKPEIVEPAAGVTLCKVCGDVANGIHFGIISCEGCKKFFRRGLTEWSNYECKDGGNCAINPRTRNACRYCRYQACLKVGMSREAIKVGRPPNSKKENARHHPYQAINLSTAHHESNPKLYMMNGYIKTETAWSPYESEPNSSLPPVGHEGQYNSSRRYLERQQSSDLNSSCTSTDIKLLMSLLDPSGDLSSLPVGFNLDDSFSLIDSHSEPLVSQKPMKLHRIEKMPLKTDAIQIVNQALIPSPNGALQKISVEPKRSGLITSPGGPITSPGGRPLSPRFNISGKHSPRTHHNNSPASQNSTPSSYNTTNQSPVYISMSNQNAPYIPLSNQHAPYISVANQNSPYGSLSSYGSLFSNCSQPHLPYNQTLNQTAAYDQPPNQLVYQNQGVNQLQTGVSTPYRSPNQMHNRVPIPTIDSSGFMPSIEQPEYREPQQITLEIAQDGSTNNPYPQELSPFSYSSSYVDSPQSGTTSGYATDSRDFLDEFSIYDPVDIRQVNYKYMPSCSLEPLIFNEEALTVDDLWSKNASKPTEDMEGSNELNDEGKPLLAGMFKRMKSIDDKVDQNYWFNHSVPPADIKYTDILKREMEYMMKGWMKSKAFIGNSSNFSPDDSKQSHWPNVKENAPLQLKMWEFIRTRLLSGTTAQVMFYQHIIGSDKVDERDQKTLVSLSSFTNCFLMNILYWWDEEREQCKYFWSWRIPASDPFYVFRQTLLKFSRAIRDLNFDEKEIMLCCALMLLSSDILQVKGKEAIEKERKSLVNLTAAYMTDKYGEKWERRFLELTSMVPALRYLSIWHHDLMAFAKTFGSAGLSLEKMRISES